MTSKAAEAEELIKKAEKCLKTSLLKWSPDLDSAIDYYKKAAVIFRNLRRLQDAANIYLLIADLQAKNGAYFHCAKSYETASMLFRDLEDFDKLVHCIETAGKLMRQNGVPDSATFVYDKGARSCEVKIPEKAAEFYESAADTSELEEKYLQAADFAGQAARVWTNMKSFSNADRLLRYQMRLCDLGATGESIVNAYQVCGKVIVSLIVIKLFQEDSVAAAKVYSEGIEKYRFGETDDCGAVARLLQVYESYDADTAAEVIKLPTFRNLPTEFGRLARSIKFPSADAVGDARAADVGAVEGREEEEEEDIC